MSLILLWYKQFSDLKKRKRGYAVRGEKDRERDRECVCERERDCESGRERNIKT